MYTYTHEIQKPPHLPSVLSRERTNKPFHFSTLFQDDIIEVHEDEMKYFADKSPGADDIDLEDLRHNKKQMAMAMERKEGMQLHSHSHSQQKNWCKRINSRLDTVYSKIRRQLHNIPRISSLKDNGVDLRYGCYSIQTLSNSSSMSPMSGSDDDSEDQLSGCEKKNLTTPKTDAEDADAAAPHDSCRPSIARVKDKMSFHTNVPSSMLTFTICAFQLTQSSGLLLSIAYLLML